MTEIQKSSDSPNWRKSDNLLDSQESSSLPTENNRNDDNLVNQLANVDTSNLIGTSDENQQDEEKFIEQLKSEGYDLIKDKNTKIIQLKNNTESVTNHAKDCELFIGKVPKEVTEMKLWPILSKYGKIFEFRIMMDYQNYNRGFAFVTYANKADATKCMKFLNNFQIKEGKFLGVCRSVDNRRLFVGGLLKSKNEDDILYEMQRMSTGVVKVISYKSVMDKNKNRGFAFVEYETHKLAAMARRKLIDSKPSLWGRPIAVDWAEPEIDIDDEIMNKVKNLYVRNLMAETTEETLEEIFIEITGKLSIERIKKIKDYAFLHFNTRENAEKAKKALHGSIIDGSVIDIHWAKPVDKESYAAYLSKKSSDKQAKEAAKHALHCGNGMLGGQHHLTGHSFRPAGATFNSHLGQISGAQTTHFNPFNPYQQTGLQMATNFASSPIGMSGIISPANTFNTQVLTQSSQPTAAQIVGGTSTTDNSQTNTTAAAAPASPQNVSNIGSNNSTSGHYFTAPYMPPGTTYQQFVVPINLQNGSTALADYIIYETPQGQKFVQAIPTLSTQMNAFPIGTQSNVQTIQGDISQQVQDSNGQLNKKEKRGAGGIRACGTRKYLQKKSDNSQTVTPGKNSSTSSPKSEKSLIALAPRFIPRSENHIKRLPDVNITENVMVNTQTSTGNDNASLTSPSGALNSMNSVQSNVSVSPAFTSPDQEQNQSSQFDLANLLAQGGDSGQNPMNNYYNGFGWPYSYDSQTIVADEATVVGEKDQGIN